MTEINGFDDPDDPKFDFLETNGELVPQYLIDYLNTLPPKKRKDMIYRIKRAYAEKNSKVVTKV